VNRFLVVDDHELLRRGLKMMLGESFPACEVGEAANAAEAIELLARASWDLLLLDLTLPGRSGLELLETVKERWPRLPVLVVTSAPEETLAVRCIRAGAAGYVTKSSASDELAGAVRKVVAGGHYITSSLAERLAKVLGGGDLADPHDLLSSRELQVISLVATGHTQREIAAELHLSEKTIATYRTRISEKLGISTLVELTRYAIQHKLVD